MGNDLLLQYIQGAVTILFGFAGILLPRKWNPFRFKSSGISKTLSMRFSEKKLDRIPKIIGFMFIFVGLFVICLTPFLGEMPW